MKELLVTKIVFSTHFWQALSIIKLDVSPSRNTVFIPVSDYEALHLGGDVISIKPARDRYDLLGCCDFKPGFAAFDHDNKSFIFFRLSCHQQ